MSLIVYGQSGEVQLGLDFPTDGSCLKCRYFSSRYIFEITLLSALVLILIQDQK